MLLSPSIVPGFAIDRSEPTGFVDRGDSAISFINGTRTFTIQPALTDFEFYVTGVKFNKSAADNKIITDSEGIHYLYYDAAGVLQSTQTFFLGLLSTTAIVAVLYWDATNSLSVYVGDERHGISMSGATHEVLHLTQGAQWSSGLGLGDFVIDGNGSLATHAQFSVADGAIYDEDIRISILDGSPQDISPVAAIPVYYKLGASGDWRKKVADAYPMIYSGTAGYAGVRLPYNEYTGAVWQLTEVANKRFVLMHYFATNDVNTPMIGVQGEETYLTKNAAREGATTELNALFTQGLPFAEFVADATVIFKTGTAYANVPKAATISIDTGIDYIDWRTQNLVPGLGTAVPTPEASGFAPERTILVALTGTDVDNIADAIAAASNLVPVPSVTAPAAIVVYPGVYSTAPFTLPGYVTLMGAAGTTSVILDASTATSPLCSSPGPSAVRQLTLRDASGAGGMGVDVSGATGLVEVDNVLIQNCETGVATVGTGFSSFLRHVEIEDGTTGYLVNGTNAVGRIESLSLSELITGLNIGSTGGTVTGTDLRCIDDVAFTQHIYVEAAGAVLGLTNANYRKDKAFYHTSASITALHTSEVPGDEAYQVTTELHVGSEDRPRESSFGGGGNHVRGMAALTNTNLEAGTWANITTQLASDDASSVALFPGTAVANAFYIGGDQPFPGINPEITTALAGGSVILEFWNGSTWVTLEHLSSDSIAPYDQYAQDVFERVSTEQIRFGVTTAWATKSLNSITKYWVRYRVATTITTPPQADRIQLHTNQAKINAEGMFEYFGTAEPIRHFGFTQSPKEIENLEPNFDQHLDFAINFSINSTQNQWQNNEIVGQSHLLRSPPGLDTSKPLTFEAGWMAKLSQSGNLEMNLDVIVVNLGDVWNNSRPLTHSLSSIITGPMTSKLGFISQFTFTVPTLKPDGFLVLGCYRDARSGNLDDTYSDDTGIGYFNIIGSVWR